MRRRALHPWIPLVHAWAAWAAWAAVAPGLAGCGDLFDFTTSATDGATEGSGTGDTGSSTGEPENCGEPPAAPVCVPPGSSSLGALCAARASQSECLAFGDGVTSKCAWAQVTTRSASADTCSGGSSRGVCIGLQATGAACNASTCAGSVAATTYYRFNTQCEVEVFQGSYCGFEVVDWSVCGWSDPPTAECSVPWPSAGPAACKCAC